MPIVERSVHFTKQLLEDSSPFLAGNILRKFTPTYRLSIFHVIFHHIADSVSASSSPALTS